MTCVHSSQARYSGAGGGRLWGLGLRVRLDMRRHNILVGHRGWLLVGHLVVVEPREWEQVRPTLSQA